RGARGPGRGARRPGRGCGSSRCASGGLRRRCPTPCRQSSPRPPPRASPVRWILGSTGVRPPDDGGAAAWPGRATGHVTSAGRVLVVAGTPAARGALQVADLEECDGRRREEREPGPGAAPQHEHEAHERDGDPAEDGPDARPAHPGADVVGALPPAAQALPDAAPRRRARCGAHARSSGAGATPGRSSGTPAWASLAGREDDAAPGLAARASRALVRAVTRPTIAPVGRHLTAREPPRGTDGGPLARRPV